MNNLSNKEMKYCLSALPEPNGYLLVEHEIELHDRKSWQDYLFNKRTGKVPDNKKVTFKIKVYREKQQNKFKWVLK